MDTTDTACRRGLPQRTGTARSPFQDGRRRRSSRSPVTKGWQDIPFPFCGSRRAGQTCRGGQEAEAGIRHGEAKEGHHLIWRMGRDEKPSPPRHEGGVRHRHRALGVPRIRKEEGPLRQTCRVVQNVRKSAKRNGFRVPQYRECDEEEAEETQAVILFSVSAYPP